MNYMLFGQSEEAKKKWAKFARTKEGKKYVLWMNWRRRYNIVLYSLIAIFVLYGLSEYIFNYSLSTSNRLFYSFGIVLTLLLLIGLIFQYRNGVINLWANPELDAVYYDQKKPGNFYAAIVFFAILYLALFCLFVYLLFIS